MEEHSLLFGFRHDCPGVFDPHLHGVKEVFVHDLEAHSTCSVGKPLCLLRDPFGHPAQTLRAVVDREHARHHGEENLGGANVARRAVATNVLFPGL